MAETILQINFKFDGSKAEYLKAFGEVAAPIAATPGLRWKVWPWNDEGQVGGGIYLSDDASSAQAFQRLLGEWLGFIDGQVQASLMKSADDVNVLAGS